MRHFAIQVLTWGTIAGAIGSAFLLAAFDRSAARYLGASALDPFLMAPSAPTQAARKGAESERKASPSPGTAASVPRAGNR